MHARNRSGQRGRVGAIAQALPEVAGVVRDDGGWNGSPANPLAPLAGLVVTYLMDLLVTPQYLKLCSYNLRCCPDVI